MPAMVLSRTTLASHLAGLPYRDETGEPTEAMGRNRKSGVVAAVAEAAGTEVGIRWGLQYEGHL